MTLRELIENEIMQSNIPINITRFDSGGHSYYEDINFLDGDEEEFDKKIEKIIVNTDEVHIYLEGDFYL